jgi:hypothetical protein
MSAFGGPGLIFFNGLQKSIEAKAASNSGTISGSSVTNRANRNAVGELQVLWARYRIRQNNASAATARFARTTSESQPRAFTETHFWNGVSEIFFPMSALPSKADVGTQPGDVRFGPTTDSCSAAKRPLFERYSITSSAVASSDGGTFMPSALAVFKLIANSNLVDCCTGKSAGFSPLRMRPV